MTEARVIMSPAEARAIADLRALVLKVAERGRHRDDSRSFTVGELTVVVTCAFSKPLKKRAVLLEAEGARGTAHEVVPFERLRSNNETRRVLSEALRTVIAKVCS